MYPPLTSIPRKAAKDCSFGGLPFRAARRWASRRSTPTTCRRSGPTRTASTPSALRPSGPSTSATPMPTCPSAVAPTCASASTSPTWRSRACCTSCCGASASACPPATACPTSWCPSPSPRTGCRSRWNGCDQSSVMPRSVASAIHCAESSSHSFFT